MSNAGTIGHDLLNVPFPEMVKNLGVGIAEAQLELDQVSMQIAQLMSGADYQTEISDDKQTNGVKKETIKGTKVPFGPQGNEFSLLELGFTPTFYQFVDTIIEVKMSINMSRTNEYSRTTTKKSAAGRFRLFRGRSVVSATSVSATYSSKYQYSAEGSSLLRTKLVPVPAPPILEERIREMLDDDNAGSS